MCSCTCSQTCLSCGILKLCFKNGSSLGNITCLGLTNRHVTLTQGQQLSRRMGKLTICIGENKGQISFAVTAKLISAFVFSTRTVQFLFYLHPKFQASSTFLCLCSFVCVGPVQKPHCWFSHQAAQLYIVPMDTLII